MQLFIHNNYRTDDENKSDQQPIAYYLSCERPGKYESPDRR